MDDAGRSLYDEDFYALKERYRRALRLLRSFEDDAPGLMQRVPAECPYSLDQIVGSGDEDWFPPAR
jgi:hypothetical protein